MRSHNDILRSLLKTLDRYGLDKTIDKSTRLSVLGRVLPRYVRSTSGRGFSWEELEEVDLRYRARASSMKYDRKNWTRGYDRATKLLLKNRDLEKSKRVLENSGNLRPKMFCDNKVIKRKYLVLM